MYCIVGFYNNKIFKKRRQDNMYDDELRNTNVMLSTMSLRKGRRGLTASYLCTKHVI
jgi:hypothetical protein